LKTRDSTCMWLLASARARTRAGNVLWPCCGNRSAICFGGCMCRC